MPRPKPRPVKHIVVHLGNVAGGLERTQKIAEARKDVRVIGIDIARHRKPKRIKNWAQITAEFESGLRKLDDGSASVISSDFAVGYYGDTEAILRLIFKKLKPNGKFRLSIGANFIAERVANKLVVAGFSSEKIKIRKLDKTEARTGWQRKAARKPNTALVGIFEVVARK